VPHGDDPILPDRVRIQLNSVLSSALRERFGSSTPFTRILRTSNEHNSKDRFLFFLAVSTATRQLKLSCASADEKGNPLTPSPFLDEVKALIGGANVRRVASPQVSTAAAECFTQREFLIHSSVSGAFDSPTVAALVPPAQVESILRRIEIERHRRDYFAIPAREESDDGSAVSRKPANEFDGLIGSSEKLAARLTGTGSAGRSWSAGSLSELASCGFKFFAHRVLRLSQLEQRGHEMDATERGSLIHDVLRDLLERVRDFSDLKAATAAAREVLAEYRRERAPRLADQSFGEILWREIERTVLEIVEFEYSSSLQGSGAARELLLEEPFSIRLDPMRSEIEAFPNGLMLQGRIDRLEIERLGGLITRLRVLDYKNSRSDRYDDLLKNQFAKTEFQLPLYLMAALERTGGQLSEAAQIAAGYLVLKRHRNKLVTRAVDRQEIEIDPTLRASPAADGHESAADRIFQVVASAAQGHFEVDPLRCDRFCVYRAACRYRRPEDLPE
jgi:ATP-dependent helicase/DNAse subunit B